MGLSLGGLLPCVATVIRHNVPERIAGSILGYSTSSQYVGQVLARWPAVSSAAISGCGRCSSGRQVLMAAGAVFTWLSRSRRKT